MNSVGGATGRRAFSDRELLATIKTLTKEHGFPPSIREIGAAVDVTPATVHTHLVRLRGEGRVAWNDGRPRTLRVVKPPVT